MQSITQIFNNLKGKWMLDRVFTDHIDQKTHFAKGEVIISALNKQENQLLYFEMGDLKLADKEKPIAFKREYIYKLVDNTIQIFFNDGISKGKLYQSLQSMEDSPSKFDGTHHLCVNDIYTGGYNFIAKNKFSISYEVKGPQKDLIIETMFERIE